MWEWFSFFFFFFFIKWETRTGLSAKPVMCATATAAYTHYLFYVYAFFSLYLFSTNFYSGFASARAWPCVWCCVHSEHTLKIKSLRCPSLRLRSHSWAVRREFNIAELSFSSLLKKKFFYWSLLTGRLFISFHRVYFTLFSGWLCEVLLLDSSFIFCFQ